MLVKFFGRGSGGGDSPVNYLLGEERNREGASVLRGNAEITKELINSTDYARRYTSGVLSFEESYKSISAAQKNKIMDAFEITLFSGLHADQYNILWVEHTDKNDRLELNFLIPNQELRSGKRLQPFFHWTDMKRVNAFQNVTNMQFKLSNPHDPSKKRFNDQSFSRDANIKNVDEIDRTKEQKRLIAHKKAKNELTAYFYELASNAKLKNRSAIQKSLEHKGYEIKRVTNRAISIKSPNFSKNIRLDDPIFSIDFRVQDYTAVAMLEKNKQYEKDKQKSIYNYSLKILNEGIKLKKEYHRERFSGADVPKPYDLEISSLLDAQRLTDDYRRPEPQDDGPSLNY